MSLKQDNFFVAVVVILTLLILPNSCTPQKSNCAKERVSHSSDLDSVFGRNKYNNDTLINKITLDSIQNRSLFFNKVTDSAFRKRYPELFSHENVDYDSSQLPPIIPSTDRQQEFKILRDEVLDSLENDNLPAFLLDPCVDYLTKTVIYSRVNSEIEASFRHDLIESLSKEQIYLILKLGYELELKKVCNFKKFCGNCDWIPYSDISTWDLLNNRLNNKNNNTKYPDYSK